MDPLTVANVIMAAATVGLLFAAWAQWRANKKLSVVAERQCELQRDVELLRTRVDAYCRLRVEPETMDVLLPVANIANLSDTGIWVEKVRVVAEDLREGEKVVDGIVDAFSDENVELGPEFVIARAGRDKGSEADVVVRIVVQFVAHGKTWELKSPEYRAGFRSNNRGVLWIERVQGSKRSLTVVLN